MCTSIVYNTPKETVFFGRTMDFSYPIESSLYVTYKGDSTSNFQNTTWVNLYNFIAIGQSHDDLLVFFDGVNEAGFACAALYFAGYADYSPNRSSIKTNIAAYDLVHYLLSNCDSLDALISLIPALNIIGVADPVTNSVAPLHWIATDRTGSCLVIELTKKGLTIVHNPIGVLANSPDIMWHNTNLRNYIEVSTVQTSYVNWDTISLTQFGQGGGSRLLPGGYTSPDRFVRTAFLKSHTTPSDTYYGSLMNCFHILESVTIPKGVVLTSHNTIDYTKYTAFMDVNTQTYYVKTYDNTQIGKASLRDYTSSTLHIDSNQTSYVNDTPSMKQGTTVYRIGSIHRPINDEFITY